MEVVAPQIQSIPYIYAPAPYVPHIYQPSTVLPPAPLKDITINAPGCTYWHRDIENTGNMNLLLDDPNGVFTICDTPFPSFTPLDYNPKNLVISEPPPSNTTEPEIPEVKQPEVPKDKKEEEVILPPCPSNKDQRIGDFRNEKKIERVIGHKRGQNGEECITLYEDVAFVDQYIPSAPQFAGVFSLALVGSSAPLILNAIKPLVKKGLATLQKKKK